MDDLIKETEALRRKFMDTYFSPKQASELLDVKIKTLDLWRAKGFGPPAYKARNGRIYYKIAELREWMLAQPELVERYAAETNKKADTPA